MCPLGQSSGGGAGQRRERRRCEHSVERGGWEERQSRWPLWWVWPGVPQKSLPKRGLGQVTVPVIQADVGEASVGGCCRGRSDLLRQPPCPGAHRPSRSWGRPGLTALIQSHRIANQSPQASSDLGLEEPLGSNPASAINECAE